MLEKLVKCSDEDLRPNLGRLHVLLFVALRTFILKVERAARRLSFHISHVNWQ